MANPKTVRVEVWPVAADQEGIWLVSGRDAWRPALPVMADTTKHADVEQLLAEAGAADQVVLLHQTSVRDEGPSSVDTYVAVLVCDGPVRAEWPDASPVSMAAAAVVGRPATHGPTDPPDPRYIDVLLHGLRHFAFLLDHDATVAAALLRSGMVEHLRGLEPALASLYAVEHQEAA